MYEGEGDPRTLASRRHWPLQVVAATAGTTVLRHSILGPMSSVLVSLFSVGFLWKDDRRGTVMNSCGGVQCDEHRKEIPTERRNKGNSRELRESANQWKVERLLLFIPCSFSDHTGTTIIQMAQKTVEILQCRSLMRLWTPVLSL